VDHNKQLEADLDKILSKLGTSNIPGTHFPEVDPGSVSYVKIQLLQRFKEQDIASRIDELHNMMADCGDKEPRFYQWSVYIDRRKAELQSRKEKQDD